LTGPSSGAGSSRRSSAACGSASSASSLSARPRSPLVDESAGWWELAPAVRCARLRDLVRTRGRSCGLLPSSPLSAARAASASAAFDAGLAVSAAGGVSALAGVCSGVALSDVGFWMSDVSSSVLM